MEHTSEEWGGAFPQSGWSHFWAGVYGSALHSLDRKIKKKKKTEKRVRNYETLSCQTPYPRTLHGSDCETAV